MAADERSVSDTGELGLCIGEQDCDFPAIPNKRRNNRIIPILKASFVCQSGTVERETGQEFTEITHPGHKGTVSSGGGFSA